MIKLISLFMIFFALASESQKLDEPSILNEGKDKVIIINDNIKNILSQWDSNAKILESDNFSPEVWGLYTKEDPNSLPMAAIGDYNGDKIKDLGLLVKTGNTIKAIVALSSSKTYEIKVIKEFNLNTSDIKSTKVGAKGQPQFNVYLFTESGKHLKHKKGLAKRDGFHIEKLNSTDTTVHYAVHQKFSEYKGLIQ